MATAAGLLRSSRDAQVFSRMSEHPWHNVGPIQGVPEMKQGTTGERELERIVKGFANHRRIQMMRLLEQRPELALLDVCKHLRVGTQAGSEHMRRLAAAGLVTKRYQGRWVRHRLTPRAEAVLTFLNTLR
jgi:DNA-binding transcriptional ArsR family regulator